MMFDPDQVVFEKPDSAIKARRMFNNTEFHGTRMKIQVCKTQGLCRPEDVQGTAVTHI